MKTATAYSPTHITGFFKAFANGSTGAGVNLSEGMTTKASVFPANKNSVEIKINGKKKQAETSFLVVQKFLAREKEKFSVKIEHRTKCPIGYGLGVSGAGAFSLSIALNEALETGLSKQEILETAKQAEIEAGTGLGDVVAEQFHGLMVGLPPFPSKKVHIIPCKKNFVVCGFFAPISTKEIISDKEIVKAINEAGDYCMQKILEKKNLERFAWLSRLFSIESGLVTKQVKQVMDRVPTASQAMLGSTAFVITDNPKETKQMLKKFCKHTLVSRIAGHGARLL